MLRQRRLLLLPMLCFLLAVPAIFGQSMTTDDQLSLLAPSISGESGLFTTLGGNTLKRGDWSFGIYLNNYDYLAAHPTSDMIIPTDNGFRLMDVDDSRVSASIGWGITDRWELAASIPYDRIQNNDGDRSGFINGFPYSGMFTDNGAGDVHIGTKFQLTDPATAASHLSISLFGNLPTGDHKSGISTGNAAYGAGLEWTYRMWNFDAIYDKVGDRDASDNPRGVDVSSPAEIHLDAGINVPLHFMPTTNWISEVNYVSYNGGDLRPPNPVFLVTGIRHWFGQSGWAFNGAVRVNVEQYSNGFKKGCPIGGLIGLTYAPMHLAAVVPPPPAPTPVPPPPPPPPPAPVTPPPEPVVPPHQPQELRTDEIHFESGSARLTNIAKAILDDVALRMKQEPTSTAVVIGYNDTQEATGAGNDLDRRRAEAVRDYLVSRHGIDPSRISVEGHDGQDPVGDNNTPEGRLRNRRVIIRLIIP